MLIFCCCWHCSVCSWRLIGRWNRNLSPTGKQSRTSSLKRKVCGFLWLYFIFWTLILLLIPLQWAGTFVSEHGRVCPHGCMINPGQRSRLMCCLCVCARLQDIRWSDAVAELHEPSAGDSCGRRTRNGGEWNEWCSRSLHGIHATASCSGYNVYLCTHWRTSLFTAHYLKFTCTIAFLFFTGHAFSILSRTSRWR